MRSTFIHLLLTSILFLLSTVSATADTTDSKQVKQVYEQYRYAILNDDGKLAFQCIDSRTKSYYGQLLNWTVNDDSIALEKHSLVDKFTVLAIRAKASKEELLGFDSSTLFMYAVNKGMVGKNGVAKQAIGDPVIDSTFAKAPLIINGKNSSTYFHFYKENNEWKINISYLLTAANTAFRNMLDETDQTENEFIMDLLRIMEGREQNATIWLPVSK